ncbi:MAG TPA: HD domain-containing protein [Longimicrobiales bacterium]
MSDGAATPPTPREWLEGEAFPWPGLDEVAEGARLAACYCVAGKQLALTKNDKPYLRLQLSDRSGEIEGRVWDDAERVHERVVEGGFVGVRGRIESFRGQRQLKVEDIAMLTVPAEDLELFLPHTSIDRDRLASELDALIASVEDPALRALLVRLLGPDSETGRAFRRAPAAKRNHHAYVGGLLEHTVSVAWVCSALARHYGAALDRDLLVAGALLHDIGKTREIAIAGGFPYTDEGNLLGHIVLGIQMVRDAAREVPELTEERALLLQHLVASHQGKYEWHSPRLPMTLEALLLHYVDDLDAKMHQALALVAASEKGWTGYDPSFGRAFLRHLDAAGARRAATDIPARQPAGAEAAGTDATAAEAFGAGGADAGAVESPGVGAAHADADAGSAGAGAVEARPAEGDAPSVDRPPADPERRSNPQFSPDTLDLFGG